MLIYVMFYVSILCCYAYSSRDKQMEQILLICLCVLLALFAGMRAIDVSADGYQYVRMFDFANNYSDWFTSQNEFMATFIPVTLKYIGIYSYFLTFLIFASLAMFIKYKVISKYSDFTYLSLLLFYSNFFLLQEMTQIRAAVALGILILSVHDVYERRRWSFAFKIFLAGLFHISSLSFVFVYILNPYKINIKGYWVLFFCILILGVLHIDFLSYLPFIGMLSKKLNNYLVLGNLGNDSLNKINLFSLPSMLNIIFLFLFMSFHERLIAHNRYSIIFIKLLFLSYASLFLLSSIPVIAFRMNELFLLSSIVSYTYLCYFIKPYWFAKLIVITLSLFFFYYNLFILGLLQPYHLIF